MIQKRIITRISFDVSILQLYCFLCIVNCFKISAIVLLKISRFLFQNYHSVFHRIDMQLTKEKQPRNWDCFSSKKYFTTFFLTKSERTYSPLLHDLPAVYTSRLLSGALFGCFPEDFGPCFSLLCSICRMKDSTSRERRIRNASCEDTPSVSPATSKIL